MFGSGYGDAAERKSPGPSRSVSRAASFVFGRGEAEQAPPMPALDTAVPVVTSPVTASPLVMPGPLDRRREMWEDDGAEVGDAAWRDEHGRLGVLPSPSVQESVGPASPGKPRKWSWIGEPVEPPLEEKRGEEDGEEMRGEGEGWMLPPPEHGLAQASTSPGEMTSAVSSTKGTLAMNAKQQAEPRVPEELSTAVPSGNADDLPSAHDEPDARRASLDNVKVRRPSVKHTQSRSASYASPAPTASRPQP